MREILSLALLAFACGTAMRDPVGAARSERSAQMLSLEHSPPSAQSVEAFATLSARGAAVARGMRELTRAVSAGDKVEIARAVGRDMCVRVAFAASSPVLAKLTDGDGNVLAASDTATTDGLLGENGPVCIRKGDAVRAVADGTGATVRWVGWVSP